MKRRTAKREEFLTKASSVREILKWKYNYYEAAPYEHKEYINCVKDFKAHRKTLTFKKLWRLKMDDLFYEESKMKVKALLNKELEESMTKISKENFDPARLLVNYDHEVLRMIRRVREEFIFYLKSPKCYPRFVEEQRNFLIQKFNGCDIESSYNIKSDEQFKRYWVDRIATLCDMEVIREKRLIRDNWRKLVPSYYDSTEKAAGVEDLQELLMSEQDED